MSQSIHRTLSELEAGLADIHQSPTAAGRLTLIVRRPAVDQREILVVGELSPADGLMGDNWRVRGSSRMPDGAAHPEKQLTLINARLLALIAPDEARWPLAGDQLAVDLDLSLANLPPGTRLTLGAASIEVTAQPHTGCHKFADRFGEAAFKWVNSPLGRELRLRGLNAKVITGGLIRVGDSVQKA